MAQYAVDLVAKVQGGRQIQAIAKKLQGVEGVASKVQRSLDGTGKKFKTAANGMRYYIDAMGRARKENGQFVSTAEAAAAGIERQGRAAGAAAKRFGALRGALGGLRGALLSVGAGAAIGKTFNDASNLESAQTRIQTLVKNYGQLDGIQKVAAKSAKKFRLSQTESLTALTDLGNRLGAQGASLKDIENIYEGFNTLLANNKVEAAQAASATLQLNQALGSNKLAGEEFNAINEATPQLLDEVARVMGVTRGQLKQLAADGKISSKVLIQALTNIRTKGAADLEASFSGAFGATREFNAALKNFSATIGTELLPAITPLLKGATELLKLFGKLPGPVKTLTAAVAGLAGAFVVLAPALSAAASGLAAFAPAAVAAGGGAKVLAGSTVVLGAALTALPWVALAAGLTAAVVGTVKYYESQRQLNALLDDGAASTEALKGKQDELKTKLEGVRSKLEGTRGKMAATGREAARLKKEAALLEGQLSRLEKTYEIRLKLIKEGFEFDSSGNASAYTVGGIRYDARTGRAINPPKTVSEQIEEQRKSVIDKDKDKNPTKKDDLAKIAQLAYGPQIIAAARANSIDPRLLAGLVQVESGFNPRAVSHAGAAGLTQLMPGTAADLGVRDRFDPMQNLMGGAKYLRQMINMFGSLEAALRAYNQGPGNQQRYPGGVSGEAVAYPGKVLSAAAGFGFGGQGVADANAAGWEAAQSKEQTRQALERQLQLQKEITALQEKQYAAQLEGDREIIARLNGEEQLLLLKGEQQEIEATINDDKEKAARLANIEERAKQVKLNTAHELLQIEKDRKQALEDALAPVQEDLELLQAKLQGKEEEYELQKQINDLVKQGVSQEQATGLVQQRAELEKQLAQLEETKAKWQSLADTIEGEIGSAMSNAITGLIDGTQTAEEAFSQMFKNIGKAFIDMATQMIAKALVMKALGILSGGAGSSVGFDGVVGGRGPQFYGPAFAGGGYTGDGPRSGGVDGEGGFPALLHPGETVVDHRQGNSGMTEAMRRYNAGNNVGGAGGGGAAGEGENGGGSGTTFNWTFQTTSFGGKEFVEREQLEQAMAMTRAESIKAGSELGMAKTLKRLQNSPSARRKLGI